MSNYFLPVFYVVLQLLILMAIGFVLRRSGGWSKEFFRGLSRLLVRIALPFYFVVRISRTDFSELRQMAVMPLSAAIIIGSGLLVSVALFRLLPFSGSDRRAGIVMSTFGNSGYMPLTLAEFIPLSIPVLTERFGLDLPPILIGAYLLFQSPTLWSVGRAILTREDGGPGTFRARELLSPPIIGILVGLALALSGFGRLIDNPLLPTTPIFRAFERLSDLTLPLLLLNLGGLIGGLEIDREDWGALLGMSGAVILVRLLLIPALFHAAFFGYLKGSGLAPAVIFVIFLESHTPPATNLSLMATESGVNEHHTSVTLLATYVLYLILMPVYLSLFLFVSS